MNVDVILARACDRVPGLLRGALVLLPDGYLLGGTRGTSALDLEPLIRSAARCLAAREAPTQGGRPAAAFVEYLFVIQDQLVVVQGGRRDVRLALAVVSTRDHNVAFVLAAARLALGDIERDIDLKAWGL